MHADRSPSDLESRAPLASRRPGHQAPSARLLLAVAVSALATGGLSGCGLGESRGLHPTPSELRERSEPTAAGGAGADAVSTAPASTPRHERVRATHDVMGTRVEALLPAGPGAEAAAQAVFKCFDEVDAQMSEWREDSPLAAVNREAGGRPVTVPAELAALVRRGVELGRRSDGAFDVTWAALWGLWDFGAPRPAVPSAERLRAATALVDYRAVELDERAGTLRLPRRGMKLGLGAIAKGYALDRAALALGALGVADYTLSAGGQVMAGLAPSGRPWRIGIRDPRGEPDDYFAVVILDEGSVSTSGDYERFFIDHGVRYHHILDPRTGRPATSLRSATVVARDATLADALSTAVMVLGVERGLALIATFPGVEALLVDARGEVHATQGLRPRLLLVHPPLEAEPAFGAKP